MNKDIVLVLEIQIDRAIGHAGFTGNLRNGGFVKTEFRKHRDRRFKDTPVLVVFAFGTDGAPLLIKSQYIMNECSFIYQVIFTPVKSNFIFLHRTPFDGRWLPGNARLQLRPFPRPCPCCSWRRLKVGELMLTIGDTADRPVTDKDGIETLTTLFRRLAPKTYPSPAGDNECTPMLAARCKAELQFKIKFEKKWCHFSIPRPRLDPESGLGTISTQRPRTELRPPIDRPPVNRQPKGD